MSRPSRSVDDSLKFTEGMSEAAKKGVVVNLEFERKYREELAQHRVKW
jgi:hypothetical protein